jgi:hypothetical protein
MIPVAMILRSIANTTFLLLRKNRTIVALPHFGHGPTASGILNEDIKRSGSLMAWMYR